MSMHRTEESVLLQGMSFDSSMSNTTLSPAESQWDADFFMGGPPNKYDVEANKPGSRRPSSFDPTLPIGARDCAGGVYGLQEAVRKLSLENSELRAANTALKQQFEKLLDVLRPVLQGQVIAAPSTAPPASVTPTVNWTAPTNPEEQKKIFYHSSDWDAKKTGGTGAVKLEDGDEGDGKQKGKVDLDTRSHSFSYLVDLEGTSCTLREACSFTDLIRDTLIDIDDESANLTPTYTKNPASVKERIVATMRAKDIRFSYAFNNWKVQRMCRDIYSKFWKDKQESLRSAVRLAKLESEKLALQAQAATQQQAAVDGNRKRKSRKPATESSSSNKKPRSSVVPASIPNPVPANLPTSMDIDEPIDIDASTRAPSPTLSYGEEVGADTNLTTPAIAALVPLPPTPAFPISSLPPTPATCNQALPPVSTTNSSLPPTPFVKSPMLPPTSTLIILEEPAGETLLSSTARLSQWAATSTSVPLSIASGEAHPGIPYRLLSGGGNGTRSGLQPSMGLLNVLDRP
ncbi:hypothetical protein NMY22_g11194 [Coprinellus aureogranulatus]|nr:hypothetical protein NMY22_g11194 [Coprinellus aureogranulatus]